MRNTSLNYLENIVQNKSLKYTENAATRSGAKNIFENAIDENAYNMIL
jgi:hypothetical protein